MYKFLSVLPVVMSLERFCRTVLLLSLIVVHITSRTNNVDALAVSNQKNENIGVNRQQLSTEYQCSTTMSSELSRRDLLHNVAATSVSSTLGLNSGLYLPGNNNDNNNRRVEAIETKITIPTVQLGQSSLYVSKTIQGYWQLAGGHGRYQESDAIANMQAHYNAGMTTLDTADIYGPSEIIIGKFMKVQPKAIPNTKFCCFRFLDDISRAEVKERILRSCERLQVSKLPLVQYFWSNYDIKRYIDVALYLTELQDQGYIQEIGATNFDLKRLQELKKFEVPIVSHQVQLSALDRRPIQSGMADWCKENRISLIAFGTVGSGTLF
jgi:diketogulonate reductase-like aldo/keto reductase